MAGVSMKKALGPALFVLLSGCTAVLGIHSAELVDDTGGWGTGSGTTSSTGTGNASNNDDSCGTAPAPDCSNCLAMTCKSALDACLTKADCRSALNDYAKCLDKDCVDTMSCAEAIGAVNQSLMTCIAGACSSKCGNSRVVSRCEIYCGCMQNICPSQFGSPLGGSLANCMNACGTLTDHDADCRSNHCEFAALSTDSARHCDHAVGGSGLCTPQHAPNACFGKKETGFPCSKSSECCSSSCEQEVCK